MKDGDSAALSPGTCRESWKDARSPSPATQLAHRALRLRLPRSNDCFGARESELTP
jgi:hypothetical protein